MTKQDTELWGRSAEFDKTRSGGDGAAAERYCRDAMGEADSNDDELLYVYFAGRLGEILVARQRLDDALRVYAALWVRPATPLLEGLAYTKLLLSVGQVEASAELVEQMQSRLQVERTDPLKGHGVAEELCLLMADGLVSLRRRKLDVVRRVCGTIVGVGADLEPDELVDPELLIALIRERQYDLARPLFEFFLSHSGPA